MEGWYNSLLDGRLNLQAAKFAVYVSAIVDATVNNINKLTAPIAKK